MIGRIRLLICLTILVVVAILVGIMRYVDTDVTGCLWQHSVGSHNAVCNPSHLPYYDDIMELLAQQQNEEARTLIAQAMGETRDSLSYYQYATLLAKYYFSTMQADSLHYATDRLRQFISHNKGIDAAAADYLTMHERMQRGVYEVKVTGRMDSALVCYEQALTLARRLGCGTSERLIILTNLADAYKQKGVYDKSVDYYQQAISLSDSVGADIPTRITIDIGLASAYAAMGCFDESAPLWQRAAELLPQMQRGDLFQYLNNRGNDYFLQEKYEESLRCFESLDSLTSLYDDMQWEHMFGYANRSHVLIKLGQTEQALPLLNEAEHFFTQQQQPIALYYLASQRMELALLEGNTTKARQIDEQSATPAWMIPEQVLIRQQLLMQLYKQTGDWHRYAETMQRQQHLRDSLMGEKARMQISAVVMRHDHERTLLEKQQQIEKKDLAYQWALTLLIAAVIVIVLLVYIAYQYKKQQELKEQAMRSRIAGLRMETVRNRITPHFMSNALSYEILAQMDGKETHLDALAQLLHRGIEMTGTEQTTLHDELEFIRFYCGVESRSIGSDFEFTASLAPNVDTQKVMLPAMTIQILVENALKHGLKRKPRENGKKRFVTVRATRQDEGTLVEVIDNGVGIDETKEIQMHTGLKVLHQTLLLLNEQNSRQMVFKLENYRHADGDTGCRATVFLPDDYHYTLSTIHHPPPI